MPTFPQKKYKSITDYASAYSQVVADAHRSVDKQALERAATALSTAFNRNRMVYACGNGGSAALSNHLACDHGKGIQTDTRLLPHVVSLSANIELITAIANDVAYADIFLYQLRTLASAGDVLITVSASGDSENVVRAVEWAKSNGLTTIAFTGFEGGRCRSLADICLHVDAHNYGVVEDVHQSMMHMLAQYLRLTNMDSALISSRKF